MLMNDSTKINIWILEAGDESRTGNSYHIDSGINTTKANFTTNKIPDGRA